MRRNESNYCRVAIPGGIPELLWYTIPADLKHLHRGSLCRVSVQGHLRTALIWETGLQPPEFKCLQVQAPEIEWTFPETYLQKMEWVSKVYMGTINQTVELFLPKNLSKLLEKATEYTPKTGAEGAKGSQISGHSKPPDLTPAQQDVANKVMPALEAKKFKGFLLHGVTGSGKTRVYLEWTKHALQLGKKVVILVPEIGLTPQTKENFQKHLNETVFMYHSGLGIKERRELWVRLLNDDSPQVILGTRSLLLLPGIQPDLMILDEEHDASYKQHDPGPRYHARDLALHLIHKRQGVIVLGSATPSLESYHNAQKGNLQLIKLQQRVMDLPMPLVSVVDMKEERPKIGRGSLLSPLLRESIQEQVDAGNQCILLHNRRGFASSRICLDCGEIHMCRDCRIPLIWHKKHNHLRCHYCDRVYQVEEPCQNCRSKNFEYQGQAIEMVEQELLESIGGAKVLRMDRDTMSTRKKMMTLLEDFRLQKANILLGTQMVAKGHDFPQVTLVGVVSADTGSSIPDFRSGERMFQLLTQVSGRAGRHDKPGQVVIQTWNPQNPILKFAMKHDYENFFAWENPQRQALQYPPWRRLLSIHFSGKAVLEVADAAQRTADQLTRLFDSGAKNSSTKDEGIFSLEEKPFIVLGPSESFVSKIKGQERMHILIKGMDLKKMREACRIALDKLPRKMRNRLKIHANYDPWDVL